MGDDMETDGRMGTRPVEWEGAEKAVKPENTVAGGLGIRPRHSRSVLKSACSHSSRSARGSRRPGPFPADAPAAGRGTNARLLRPGRDRRDLVREDAGEVRHTVHAKEVLAEGEDLLVARELHERALVEPAQERAVT